MAGEMPDPADATSYFKMANVYSSQGKYEEALELYRKSVDIRIKVPKPQTRGICIPLAPNPKPPTPNPQP